MVWVKKLEHLATYCLSFVAIYWCCPIQVSVWFQALYVGLSMGKGANWDIIEAISCILPPSPSFMPLLMLTNYLTQQAQKVRQAAVQKTVSCFIFVHIWWLRDWSRGVASLTVPFSPFFVKFASFFLIFSQTWLNFVLILARGGGGGGQPWKILATPLDSSCISLWYKLLKSWLVY